MFVCGGACVRVKARVCAPKMVLSDKAMQILLLVLFHPFKLPPRAQFSGLCRTERFPPRSALTYASYRGGCGGCTAVCYVNPLSAIGQRSDSEVY